MDRVMAEAKDGDNGDGELAIIEKEIKEFWNKFKINCSESFEQTLGLKTLWQESLNRLSDKWSKRLTEGDQIIKKCHEFSDELRQRSNSIGKKQEKLSEVLGDIEDGRKQEADLMESIQKLKGGLIRRQSKGKAAEEKLARFHKAEKLFKEWLSLEIRKVCANHLQFVFRCVDPKDLDKAYTLTLSLNDEGAFEVIACCPPLDCIEELQLKLRETNNFSAFIANVRKAFIALTCK